MSPEKLIEIQCGISRIEDIIWKNYESFTAHFDINSDVHHVLFGKYFATVKLQNSEHNIHYDALAILLEQV